MQIMQYFKVVKYNYYVKKIVLVSFWNIMEIVIMLEFIKTLINVYFGIFEICNLIYLSRNGI